MLAAAYAEAGRFDEAVAITQKARDLVQALSQNDLAQKNQTLLELFQSCGCNQGVIPVIPRLRHVTTPLPGRIWEWPNEKDRAGGTVCNNHKQLHATPRSAPPPPFQCMEQ